MKTVTRELVFGDTTVTVRELTVAEIRAWLLDSNEEVQEFDVIVNGRLFQFNHDISLFELYRFTDLTKEAIENLSFSALEQIVEVVYTLNRFFFDHYLPTLKQMSSELKSVEKQTQ